MVSFKRCTLAVLALSAPAHADETHTLAPLFSDLETKLITPAQITETFKPLPDWLEFDRWVNGFGQYVSSRRSCPPPLARTQNAVFNSSFTYPETQAGISANGTTIFTFDYLFDVLSYVQKWSVKDGKVSYGHKMTQSNYYNQTVTGERPLLRSFGGVSPDLTPKEVAETIVATSVSDNFNVNVVKVGKHVFTISDTTGQVEIDPETLDTIGGFHYDDELDTQMMGIISCAHPTQLPGDKYMYNYQTKLFGNAPHHKAPHKIQFYRVDTTAEELTREVVIEIEVKDLSYLHQVSAQS